MKLATWLQAEGKRQEEFGRQVGLTQGRISQIAQRGTTDLGTALRIEAATDRQVTVADLLMGAEQGSAPNPDTAGAAQ